MAGSTTEKKWTVMVYLAGDNDLDQNGVTDLKEMKKVGSTGNVNVIAEFDRAAGRMPTKRYYLRKGTSLNADAVQSVGEINTGSPEALVDFAKWGIANYPARHYLFVLWNHGQGWDDTDIFAGERGANARLLRVNRVRHAFFKTSVVKAAGFSAGEGQTLRAILIDDDAKDFLDNLEMKKALESVKTALKHKVDILGMDACLMSMAEVAYQMRNSVQYAVGSEETEPVDGWPYDAILAALTAKPDMSADALSKLIVNKYNASYKGSGEAVTQSALALPASTKFADAVKALASALKAALADKKSLAAIADVRNRVQEYYVNDNVDLVDLCSLLDRASVPASVKSACKDVLASIRGAGGLVTASAYYGASMKRSNGVAIYFPTRSVSPLYAKLDFTKKTGWGAFLKAYVAATRSR